MGQRTRRLRDKCSEAHSDSLVLLGPSLGSPPVTWGPSRPAGSGGRERQAADAQPSPRVEAQPPLLCASLLAPRVPLRVCGGRCAPPWNQGRSAHMVSRPPAPGLWFCSHALGAAGSRLSRTPRLGWVTPRLAHRRDTLGERRAHVQNHFPSAPTGSPEGRTPALPTLGRARGGPGSPAPKSTAPAPSPRLSLPAHAALPEQPGPLPSWGPFLGWAGLTAASQSRLRDALCRMSTFRPDSCFQLLGAEPPVSACDFHLRALAFPPLPFASCLRAQPRGPPLQAF